MISLHVHSVVLLIVVFVYRNSIRHLFRNPLFLVLPGFKEPCERVADTLPVTARTDTRFILFSAEHEQDILLAREHIALSRQVSVVIQ
jgi:hypothetical protein